MRIIQKLKPINTLSKKKRVAAYTKVSSGKDSMIHSLSAQISLLDFQVKDTRLSTQKPGFTEKTNLSQKR
jgi:hypothetical protein